MNREILLNDLCGRIPYGVKVEVHLEDKTVIGTITEISSDGIVKFGYENEEGETKVGICPVEKCKPFLRSYKTMTDEECEVYRSVAESYMDTWLQIHYHLTPEALDFVNSHHLDYRDILTEREGLAIAVTKENNPYGCELYEGEV